MSLRAGTRLDRYVIEALLGSGGMGRVYRAFDSRLMRQVAIKVLDPVGTSQVEAVTAALREARAAATVVHPGVAAIFDVGTADGMSFIVMELVRGTPLRDHVGDKAASTAMRVRWLAEIAAALAAAHALGVVHRDVKPGNVIVNEEGAVKVLDFGVARLPQPATPGEEGMGTLSGQGLLGTPEYMAPEQIQGGPVDARADQFGWGVLAYELLTGATPWPRTSNPFQTLLAVLSPDPVRFPEGSALPASLRAVVLRALSKSPGARFASMNDVVDALLPPGSAGPRRLPTPPARPETPTGRAAPNWLAPGGLQASAERAPPVVRVEEAPRRMPTLRDDPFDRRATPALRPEATGSSGPPTLRAEVPPPRTSTRPRFDAGARGTPALRPEATGSPLPRVEASAPRPGARSRFDDEARPPPLPRTDAPLSRTSTRPRFDDGGRQTPTLRTDVPSGRTTQPRFDDGGRQTPTLRTDVPSGRTTQPRPGDGGALGARSTTPTRSGDGARLTPALRPDLPAEPRRTPTLRAELPRDAPASTRRSREVLAGPRPPNLDAPVDLRAHLALLPPSAATKGMFVADLLGAASRHLTAFEVRALAGVPDRRIFPFSNYPMAEYMKIQIVVAGALHRDAPLGEGLRRLGQRAFATLLDSQVGRTLFGLLDRDFERLMALVGRAHDLTLNFGALGVEKSGPGRYLVRARDLPVFLETYQVGVIEGMLDHCGERAQIRVAVERLDSAVLEVELG